jgi:DNA repair exonuclease SbcCD ATPase subunit
MRRFKFTLIAVLFIMNTPSVMNAQVTVKSPEAVSLVREGERQMSQGSKNSLTIELNKTTAKFAEKIWKDYTKQFKGDTKRDKKSDEWLTDNAQIAAIGGANTVDMYVKFSESGDNTNVALWVDLGGTYVNSNEVADKYKEAEKLLLNYSIAVQKEQTRIQLEDQQKELQKLERQLKNLEKDNTGLHKDIEDYKKRILKAEEDIKTNLKNQDDTKAKIEAQKKAVDEVLKKMNSLN